MTNRNNNESFLSHSGYLIYLPMFLNDISQKQLNVTSVSILNYINYKNLTIKMSCTGRDEVFKLEKFVTTLTVHIIINFPVQTQKLLQWQKILMNEDSVMLTLLMISLNVQF